MSKCDVCINRKYCVNHLDARTMCPQMDYVLFTPSYKTNYDRLISKTPEELAGWILSETTVDFFSVCPPGTTTGEDCATSPCEQCWLDWLKSPEEKGE